MDCPFQRQLDELCDLTYMALRDPSQVAEVRAAVGESRRVVAARRATLGGRLAPEIDRFVGRFLRVLAAADQRLGPAEGSELASYVDRRLGGGRLVDCLPRPLTAY